jgi:aryl-alcohol dehydrogenase-like predicted oxidoreductase
VLTRRLGRTDHWSSLAILGGAAYWDANPESAEASFTAALEAGVNHLDIAPRYGQAQAALGPHVARVRDRLFVGAKTARHQSAGVRAQLEETLALLGCSSLDLYQLHAVTTVEELDARADAMAEVLAARDEGLCRFVGITGHDVTAPATHAAALERYDLDTVMFPVNARLWGIDDYRRDAETLLEICEQRDVGVMAIQAVAARPWGAGERTATTWYEPYTDDEEIERQVRFTLSVPGVTGFCTPGDTALLPAALAAASNFSLLDDTERRAAMAAVANEPLIFPMPQA